MIVAGLGLATIGFGARYVIRAMPKLGEKMAEASIKMPKLDSKVSYILLNENNFYWYPVK